MCGRFYIESLADPVREALSLPKAALEPNWNAAPTQDIAILRPVARGLEVAQAQWGLLPAWSSDEDAAKMRGRFFNARSETAAEKPAFREAFARRRCLVPADGFYEWAPPKLKGGRKQPLAVRTTDDCGEPSQMLMAGIWETRSGGGASFDTVSILTCPANATIAAFHERMPVIFEARVALDWLGETDPMRSRAMLETFPADRTVWHEVSGKVNSVSNKGPELAAPLSEEERPPPETLFG